MSCNCYNGFLLCSFCHFDSWLFICSIPMFLSRLSRVRAQCFSALSYRSRLLQLLVFAEERLVGLFASELWVRDQSLEAVCIKAEYGHAAEVVRACLYNLKRISANHNSCQPSSHAAHGMCSTKCKESILCAGPQSCPYQHWSMLDVALYVAF